MNRTPRQLASPRTETLVGNGWLMEAPENVRAAMRKRWMRLVVPRDARGMPAFPIPPHAAPVPSATPESPRMRPSAPHVAPPAKDARQGSRPQAPGAQVVWDDPIMIGTLLIFAPPLGLAALWASRHYSRDARWALTGMTGLILCFATTVVVVVAR